MLIMQGESKSQKQIVSEFQICKTVTPAHESIKESMTELKRADTQKFKSYVLDALKLDSKKNNAKRKKMLRELANILGAPVIAYVENRYFSMSSMDQENEKFIIDIISSLPKGTKKVNLIISSLGGDPDTSIKQAQVLRNSFPEGFNIIIPHFAKSAATLISLGATKIIMSPFSELGPIDPILVKYEGEEEHTSVPAKNYLGAISEAKRMIINEEDSEIRDIYLKKLDSHVDFKFIKLCKDWLKTIELDARLMLELGAMKGRTKEEINNTISHLISDPDHLLHTSVINAAEAKTKLNLNVELWNIHDPRFKLLWTYYMCAEALFKIENISKLYEGPNLTIKEIYEVEEESNAPDHTNEDSAADAIKILRR